MSAEYVLAEGNTDVVLVEPRRPEFEDSTLNMLDMSRPQREGPEPPADHRGPEPRHRSPRT